jgi:hypothetical protein
MQPPQRDAVDDLERRHGIGPRARSVEAEVVEHARAVRCQRHGRADLAGKVRLFKDLDQGGFLELVEARFEADELM